SIPCCRSRRATRPRRFSSRRPAACGSRFTSCCLPSIGCSFPRTLVQHDLQNTGARGSLMLSILMTVSFIVLIALRMPVSMAIGLATLPPLLLLNRNLVVVPQFMLQGVHSTALLAVPFFVLAGSLFSTLGLSRRIWAFAQAFVGHIRGGLGHVMV